MATGGWRSFTTILRTLGGPARGVVRAGRYASGAGSTVDLIHLGGFHGAWRLGAPAIACSSGSMAQLRQGLRKMGAVKQISFAIHKQWSVILSENKLVLLVTLVSFIKTGR